MKSLTPTLKKAMKFCHKNILYIVAALVVLVVVVIVVRRNSVMNKIKSQPQPQPNTPMETINNVESFSQCNYRSVNDLQPESGVNLVMFHVGWCGYCRDFKPVFEAVRDANTNSNVNMLLVNGEDDQCSDICSELKISGYPTLMVFDGNNYRQVSREELPSRSEADLVNLVNNL